MYKHDVMKLGSCVLLVATWAVGCDSAFLHDIPDRLDANVASGNPPAAPTDLTAVGGPVSVTLDWSAPDAAESFTVYWSRSPSPRPDSGAERIDNATRPYVHSGLVELATYYYVVTASNASGESDYSNEASATTERACAPDGAPTSLVATYVGTNTVDLSWECDATNEDGFVVWRQVFGGTWGEVERLGPDATGTTDTAIARDSRYLYRVSAYKGACESATTNVEEVWTEPIPPGNFAAATEAVDAIMLTWTDTNVNETAHQVERRLDGAGTFEVVATLAGDVTSHSDSGLDSNTTYEYRLVVQNPEQDSTAVLATSRTSANPTIAPTGTPTLDAGCELYMTGTATYDTAVTGLAYDSASGTISGNVTGTVVASDSEWRGTLDIPNSGGSFTATWTVVDTYGGAGTATQDLTLLREQRSTTDPRLALGTLGSDNAPGRQAFAATSCAYCAGGRTSLALGSSHSCAINDTGGVSCWGSNGSGQLAHGYTPQPRVDTPAAVCDTGLGTTCSLGAPLTGVSGLTAAYLTSCATVGGERRCWGFNYRGQIGTGNDEPVANPMTVCASGEGATCTALTSVAQLAPGTGYTCARMSDTSVQCWGGMYNGVLGDGIGTYSTADARFTPGPVCATGTGGTCVALTGVDEIAAGTMHVCARVGSNVKCWGKPYNGQLGIGVTENTPYANPVDVCSQDGCGTLLGNVVQLASGERHMCARLGDDRILCWGSGTKLGYGGIASQNLPVGVCETGTWDGTACDGGTRLEGAKAIWSGYQNVCAHVDGPDADALPDRLVCWGENDYGQVGSGEVSFYETNPVDVCASGSVGGGDCAPLDNVTSVAIGRNHACALLGDGTVACWGQNSVGQIGTGAADDADVLNPSVVCASGSGGTCIPLSGVQQLVAAEYHTCALLTGGDVHCWGKTQYLGLGDASTVINPVETCTSGDFPGCTGGTGMPQMIQLSSSAYHTCGVTEVGEVMCWGRNENGPSPTVYYLGDGVGGVREYPVHVCASGQGPSCTRLTGAIEVSAGESHTCVLLNTGGVVCWGEGDDGRLGRGTADDQMLPAPVLCGAAGAGCSGSGEELTDIVGLAIGSRQSCALTSAGGVACWGYQGDGRLGDGSLDTATTYRGVARDVCATGSISGGSCVSFSGAVAIAAGPDHTCALMASSGEVRCWGAGDLGAVGVEPAADAINPNTICDPTGPGCTPLTQAIALSAGGSAGDSMFPGPAATCALLTDGSVWCWGDNSSGQLGNGFVGGATARAQPACLTGSGGTCAPLSGAVAVELGSGHTCAQLDGGETVCWGSQVSGQTGYQISTTPNPNPETVCATGEGPSCTTGTVWNGADHATCELYSLP